MAKICVTDLTEGCVIKAERASSPCSGRLARRNSACLINARGAGRTCDCLVILETLNHVNLRL